MDTYLEEQWEDVHTCLISYVADDIQPQLAPDLVARMPTAFVVEDELKSVTSVPDADVVMRPGRFGSRAAGSGTMVIDEPIMLERRSDPIRQRSVVIHDLAGNRVVTAIELLSPWNKKPGPERRDYLKKRNRYLNSEANLVEIDLVRRGDWLDRIGPYIVPKEARTTYRVTVSTPGADGPYHYPIPLRSKLPTISVPLRPQDSLVILELQKLFEKAYVMGRYDGTDYTKPCRPPLTGNDKEWAEECIRRRDGHSAAAGPQG